jgi:hypothetical protein
VLGLVEVEGIHAEGSRRCTLAWHAVHSVIKFSSESGSRLAAQFPVVHLEIRHRATGLTPPAVAKQDLLPQSFVRLWIKSQCTLGRNAAAA